MQKKEKFPKLERIYRDCIKETSDKTWMFSILHDAPGASCIASSACAQAHEGILILSYKYVHVH